MIPPIALSYLELNAIALLCKDQRRQVEMEGAVSARFLNFALVELGYCERFW